MIFGTYPYEEALVPDYVLLDPLISSNGVKINSPLEWMTFQRESILDHLKITARLV